MKTARDALRDGAAALVRMQEDGHWEGEMRWCPMLTAQYVLFHQAYGIAIPEARRRRILVHFERSRIAEGTWGLHDHAAPSLYVTTLVYVASRLLGASAHENWLAPARALFAREPVTEIATWGRAWLSIVGAYEWTGMNAMPPELWALPESVPVHPSRFYCHTRLIYLALSLLRSEAKPANVTPTVLEIRRELYPYASYESIDFRAARGKLAAIDVAAPIHPVMRVGFAVASVWENIHPRAYREKLIAELRERIRWELRTTDHLAVSPVSGMLGMLALGDVNDAHVVRGIASLSTWAFDDDEHGFRITGARSQTWDTAFALQALVAAAPVSAHPTNVGHGAEYLAAQQIRSTFPGWERANRIDPEGGFCFAHREHGWPVSDCTAEALIALLEVDLPSVEVDALHAAARFILRCQNDDGGFGSYEARKGSSNLAWLNPSEMFLDCVTESSYVECTSSSILALVAWLDRFPSHALAEAIRVAVDRAAAFLRSAQFADGSWDGVWGVGRIYGTMFGIRGLRAAGATPRDEAIERAVRFLERIQHADGSFGEHERGGVVGRYIDLGRGHVVQTAWAAMGLVESGVDDAASAIERATQYLARTQNDDGTWSRDRMVGVFFRTALVDYDLYRIYFPVWALALAEEARRTRTARPERKRDDATGTWRTA